jgi:hypothetical protein
VTTLVVLSVVDIVLLIAGLAIYLYVVGTQLARIATNLEECAEIVQRICANAAPIMQDVQHINRTGGVVAGALPLLYGMAEQIVTSVTPRPPEPTGLAGGRPPALPASGTRRSRLGENVGYHPDSDPVRV